jgi:hypothetical protein
MNHTVTVLNLWSFTPHLLLTNKRETDSRWHNVFMGFFIFLIIYNLYWPNVMLSDHCTAAMHAKKKKKILISLTLPNIKIWLPLPQKRNIYSGLSPNSGIQGGGSNPPWNSEGPPKSCQTQPQLWTLLKIAEFGAPTPQDVQRKGSKILKLPPVHNCFTLAMTNKLVVIINSL